MSTKSRNLHPHIHPLLPRCCVMFKVIFIAFFTSANQATAFMPRLAFSGTSVLSHQYSEDTPFRTWRPLLAKKSKKFAALERGDHGAATAVPERKSKHRVRKKKARRTKNVVEAISEQDMAHHVARQYLTGGGGAFHESRLKGKRLEKQTSWMYSDMNQSHQEHLENIKRLDRHPVLVLNADYQPMSHLPLSLWNWQDAVKAVFSGKVTVVDVYPDVTIRACNLEVPLPSVIALNQYVPQFKQQPAFTKRNVFLRDEYRCQYCSDYFHTRDLSLDHVVPRCLGGKLSWENAVTCCNKCNCRKGSLPVAKLRSVGMKLMREPFVPTQFQLASVAGRMLPKRVHSTWTPYLELYGGPKGGLSSNSSSKQGANVSKEETSLDGL